jgi:eukaryotic-like serine/threonine-protein kinase
LGHAALSLESGLLLCELGEIRKEVYLKEGTAHFVSSNLASELLGEYLVARGVISRGELDMALAVMPRFEGRLGETLTALGLVEPVHLFQHIAGQVRSKLLDLFLWTSGTASLYRGVAPPPSGFPLGIDPWQVLFEGIRMRMEAGAADAQLDDRLADQIQMVQTVLTNDQILVLPPDAKTVLSASQRRQRLSELTASVESRGVRPSDARCAVILLLHVGALRWNDSDRS